MNGKEKCKILKEIRHQIARENDITLTVRECTHKGNCAGTCPRCESEVRYLERELKKREKLRRRVTIAGISTVFTMALTGCTMADCTTNGLPLPSPPAPISDDLTGDVAIPDEPDSNGTFVTDGEISPEDMIKDSEQSD